jgi:hypothetical protein
MSGKMNWDRVRSENRAHLQGSEHIDATSRVLTSTGQWAPPAKHSKKFEIKRAKGVSRSVRPLPGCTCGKLVGFTGQHKARCGVCKKVGKIQTSSRAPASPSPRIESQASLLPPAAQTQLTFLSLSEFVVRLNRVHLDVDLKNLLNLWQRRLAKDRISSAMDKNLALEAIQAMRANLDKFN